MKQQAWGFAASCLIIIMKVGDTGQQPVCRRVGGLGCTRWANSAAKPTATANGRINRNMIAKALNGAGWADIKTA